MPPRQHGGAGGLGIRPVDWEMSIPRPTTPGILGRMPCTTICGSFSRDLGQIRDDIEAFRSKGVQVLSPKSAEIQESRSKFAYVYGDSYRSERAVEDRHLAAILHSDFVWIANADGIPGTATLLELGYTMRGRTPIYSRQRFSDPHLRAYIRVVADPVDAVRHFRSHHKTKPSDPNLLLNPSQALRAIEYHLGEIKRLLSLRPQGFFKHQEHELYYHWRAIRRITTHPTLD